jgi:peroxiredoxin
MKLAFDGCALDSDTREVFRDGRPVALSPKAFTLLAHSPLVSAEGRDGLTRSAMRRTSQASMIGLWLLASAALTALDLGVTAPDFTMATLDGRQFSMAEAAKTHSGVVVLFMSTICPYSNYYDDLYRDMAAEFGKKGVIFVGINSGTLETVAEVKAHALEHGHTFDIIKDPESKIADLLDARRTPEVFLFDHMGTLRYRGRVASKLSSPDLKSAIEAMLEGRVIRPAETKAFGCAILRH